MTAPDGSSVGLSGLTDTELFGELRRGAMSFRLTAVLPTGRTGLDEEAASTSSISRDSNRTRAFPF